ncbi:hypothetical protein NONO_c47490 [Nocardia nova SH22a]|uniref:Uncharacterized protein n=1 Tax=Nocardia nova SH22a TaxID=1415166 RepID=W5TKP7_9NOCA|nr:hypothetical protein NONO_c47490 [Nocardia nova SH22a]
MTAVGHLLEFQQATVAAHAWHTECLAGVPAVSDCSTLP